MRWIPAILFFLAFLIFLHRGIEGLVDDGAGSEAFWGWSVLWLVIMVGAWLITAAIANSGQRPATLGANAFVTGRNHFARLHDDTTLFHDPATAAPTLAQRYYPSERRPLLKIWRTGEPKIYVRSDRHSLVFAFSATPAAADQKWTVMAPLSPMTAAEYAKYVKRAVGDSSGNFNATLDAKPHDPEDLDYELPPGEVFADHGDDATTESAHDSAAATFREVGKDEGNAFVIYHAPRRYQSAAYGSRGSVLTDDDRRTRATGAGSITGAANTTAIPGAGSAFWTFFRPGDVINTTSAAGANQLRTVTAVRDDSNLTIIAPFTTAAPAGTTYARCRVTHGTVSGPGTVSAGAASNQLNGSAPPNGTEFTKLFEPGDIVRLTTPNAADVTRMVIRVVNDRQLIVNANYSAAVPAGTAYVRAPSSRMEDARGPGIIAPAAGNAHAITGTNTAFDAFFLPGDTIRALPVQGATTLSPEERKVTGVTSATALTIDEPFSRVVGQAGITTQYERVGQIVTHGLRAVPDAPADLFGGKSLLDRAGDLAALLCMGAASHTMTDAQRAAVTAGPDHRQRGQVNKVYQVFRNWNLDERRVNEWKMLVTGGAVSEKGGSPANPDSMQPTARAGWSVFSERGEPTANATGWVPLLKRWVDMARRPGVDSESTTSFRPGDPSNLQLSRAIAYLLDLPDPEPAP